MPFMISGVCALLLTISAIAVNKLKLGFPALQLISVVAVLCAAAPVVVHWMARQSGGGLQIMMPSRMLALILAMNLSWMTASLCLVAAVFAAALAIALLCPCVDWVVLVIVNCIVCGAVLVERWCW